MTAVEWFANQLGITSGTMLEQAKEMERLQLADAQSYAISNADMTNNRGYFDCDKWYAETYGSKGSDEIGQSLEWNGEVTQGSNGNLKQFSLYEHKETIATANTPTSSQTEISDEEIEEGAYRYDENQVVSDYRNSSTYGDFIEGAKWYREQLKSRQ